MRIYVEEQYVRAVPGGVGYAKAAGNYGAAMYATAQAKKRVTTRCFGWTPTSISMLQECGTMNVFSL